MSNHIKPLLNSCLEFVQTRLPQACLLCGGPCRGTLLCSGCDADLPRLAGAGHCAQCAVPLPSQAGESAVCGACLKRPPAYAHTRAAFAYRFPLDALVRRYKYHGALALGGVFAHALAARADATAHLPNPLPDLLLPMPLHPIRLAERGYNQAAEIARRLAPLIDRPWLAEGCRRVRDTPPQAGLDLKARRRNLRGAFACDMDLSGKHVALVDDVMTSGSSLNELAKVVRRAGAAQVSAWVVARAL